jgi:hypothetical protein
VTHPYLTYSPTRRVEWKGHDTKEGVRRAIRYAQASGTPLRVFVDRDLPEPVTDYAEIAPDYWAGMFLAE